MEIEFTASILLTLTRRHHLLRDKTRRNSLCQQSEEHLRKRIELHDRLRQVQSAFLESR